LSVLRIQSRIRPLFDVFVSTFSGCKNLVHIKKNDSVGFTHKKAVFPSLLEFLILWKEERLGNRLFENLLGHKFLFFFFFADQGGKKSKEWAHSGQFPA
jgi:hypothetical protein